MCVVHIAPIDSEDPYRVPDSKFDDFVANGIDKAFNKDEEEENENGQE